MAVVMAVRVMKQRAHWDVKGYSRRWKSRKTTHKAAGRTRPKDAATAAPRA